VDLNADGNIDLLGEGYAGLTYVLYGNNDGSLNEAVVLKDKSGTDIHLEVYYDFKMNKYQGQDIEDGDKGDFVKAHDWDNDGDLDLLISGGKGVHLRMNEGTKKKPVFATKNIKVLPAYYADAIVDWDGDGLWDILGGSKQGGVYFYKNIGKLGTPSFGEAVCIIKPSEFVNKKFGGRCGLTQIAVADYNNDDKLDILVGNNNSVNKPTPKLTDAQLKEKELLQKKTKEIEKKMDVYYKDFQKKYKNDQEKMYKAMNEDKGFKKLDDEYMKIYLKLNKLMPGKESHGYVWLSLRK
jgi:hypothetical protein